MAERKPLIQPDALPKNSISRIIQRDRVESGRDLGEDVDQAPVDQDEWEPSRLTSKLTSKTSDPLVFSKNAAQTETSDTKTAVSRREMRRVVAEMADTPLITVSLKLPSGLNDWLDTHAFTHRKAGAKKQDLIARAVELLILETTLESQTKPD